MTQIQEKMWSNLSQPTFKIDQTRKISNTKVIINTLVWTLNRRWWGTHWNYHKLMFTFTRMILSFSKLSSMPSISVMILVALLHKVPIRFPSQIIWSICLPISLFIKKRKNILTWKMLQICVLFFFTLSFGSINVDLSPFPFQGTSPTSQFQP